MLRSLVILFAMVMTGATAAPAQAQPADTPAWRVGDALDELFDPRSTPLAREVARLRLKDFKALDWLQWAAADYSSQLDPDAAEANVIRFRISQQAAWDIFLKVDADLAQWYRARQKMALSLNAFAVDALQSPADIRESLVDAVRSNMNALAGGRVSQRYQAVLNLERLGPLASPAVAVLQNALKDDDGDVRDAAARTLGTYEALQAARRARWIDQLSNPDPNMRLAAAAALVEDHFIPADAAKTIAQAMKGDAVGRLGIVAGLERAWRQDIDLDQALARMMRDANQPLSRLTTAIAIKIMAAKSADASIYQAERSAIVDALKEHVAQGHSSTAVTALRMLRQLDVNPPELVDVLSAAALSNDAQLRHEASQQLLLAGKAGEQAWLAMFDDPRREVKGLALSEAVQIGPQAAPALKAIIKLSKDGDPTLRRMAATALGALGPAAKAGLDRLLELFADTDPDVRQEAVSAARRLAPADPRVLSGLYQMMQDPDPILRNWARSRVAEIKQRERDTALANPVELLQQLRSKDPPMRLQAARAMQARHVLPTRIETALLKAVEERDFAAREGLVMAIHEAWNSHIEITSALSMMEKDPKRRAYARAAARAVETATKPPE